VLFPYGNTVYTVAEWPKPRSTILYVMPMVGVLLHWPGYTTIPDYPGKEIRPKMAHDTRDADTQQNMAVKGRL
jgi:hypothetical protein